MEVRLCCLGPMLASKMGNSRYGESSKPHVRVNEHVQQGGWLGYLDIFEFLDYYLSFLAV